MAFPAFLDTCALHGGYLCDTLLRLAEAEVFRPLWSADVLAELDRNLRERGLPVATVENRIAEMRRAFPDAEVTGYQPLIATMTCDEKDRHVLAAAVRARAEVLVTFNVRDFPPESTNAYKRPETALPDLLTHLAAAEVPGFAAEARRHLPPRTA